MPAAAAAAPLIGVVAADAWPPLTREAVFWTSHVLFWAAVFAALQLVVAVYRPEFADPPAIRAARVAACLAATAVMRSLSKQPRLLERLDVTRAGLVAGGLLSAAVAITIVFGVVARDFFPAAEPPSRGRLVADLAVNLTLLANWSALYFGSQLIRERTSAEFRALEAQAAALQSALHRLQAQISPHFLFNALNMVLASRDDPAAIETVAQSLADYLRFLLRPAATLEPLARELDALENYLTIQGVRFGAALETRIDCDLDVRGLPVPPAVVQPLVENALKYGTASGDGPLRVEVTARRDGDQLAIDVANTGRWVPPGRAGSTGTGLESLAGRLRLLLGGEARVTYAEETGWVRVQVRIPLAALAEGTEGP